MKAHAVSGQFAAPSGTQTVLSLLATSTRRVKLLRLVAGCSDGTPVDAQALFSIRCITTDGTGTANNGITGPQQDDAADGAPAITSKIAYSVEPTYQNGTIVDFPLHCRNSLNLSLEDFLGDPPATNLSAGTVIGFGIVMKGNSTVSGKNYNVSVQWEE